MATIAPWIQRETIQDEVLREIYASDQDIYPAPLTYDRLKSWAAACPELSISFRVTPTDDDVDTTSSLVGVVIVLPLIRKYWEELRAGKLKEVNIEPATMFAKAPAVDVGLHVFHVERFDAFGPLGKLRHFAEFAMENARDIARKNEWRVLGYSGIDSSFSSSSFGQSTGCISVSLANQAIALTATPGGRTSCARMGFQPTGYEEIFVTGETSDNGTQKVQMVYVYPNNVEDSNSMPSKLGSILAKSEMVVRNHNESFWHVAS
jgi:hypothetical protein